MRPPGALGPFEGLLDNARIVLGQAILVVSLFLGLIFLYDSICDQGGLSNPIDAIGDFFAQLKPKSSVILGVFLGTYLYARYMERIERLFRQIPTSS